MTTTHVVTTTQVIRTEDASDTRVAERKLVHTQGVMIGNDAYHATA